MDGLLQAGRIRPAEKNNRGKVLAEQLIRQGWEMKVEWASSTKCIVPSQRDPLQHYWVDLMHCTCECNAAAQEGKFILPTNIFLGI